MSARKAMHGPGFCPFMMATVLVPEIPSISGMPSDVRVLRIYSAVFVSSKDNSGWR